MNDIYYQVADRTDEQIRSFKNRYNFISQEDIIEIFNIIGYKVESLEKSSSWGTAHIIYYAKIVGQDTRLVFRANSGEKGGFSQPEVVMFSEQVITDLVNNLGVKTNKIIFVDISRNLYPFDYQIEEELIGVDPEKYIDKNGKFIDSKEDYDRLSYELGQAIAKYSELRFKGFGLLDEIKIIEGDIKGKNNDFYAYITTNLDLHLQFLLMNKIINKYILDKIINIFEQYKETINNCESCLVHHDLADHNLIYDTTKKGLGAIFDWEAMVLGDPMLDLGSCPTWKSHYPRRAKLLEGYTSIKKLPIDYELRINLYELRTLIWKTVFSVRMNFDKNIIKGKIGRISEIINYF